MTQNSNTKTTPEFNNEFVYCTSVGFNHLIRKGKNVRSKNEQKRRFILMPYIEGILKNEKITIKYEERIAIRKINKFGNKIKVQSKAQFWTLVSYIGKCKVKLVVRQIDNGNKHFFSIMADDACVKQVNTKKST